MSLTFDSSDTAISRSVFDAPLFSALTAPPDINGFDCFAVNVMGPGIGAPPTYRDQINVDAALRGEACSTYPGIASSFVTNEGGTMEVLVPIGPNRVVQVVGLKTIMGCPSKTFNDFCDSVGGNGGCDSYFPAMMEVGRKVLDVFSDTSLTIASSYDSSTAKDIRCHSENNSLQLLAINALQYTGMFSNPSVSAIYPYPGTPLSGPSYCTWNNAVTPNIIAVFDAGKIDPNQKKLRVTIDGYAGSEVSACFAETPSSFGYELRYATAPSAWSSEAFTGTNGITTFELDDPAMTPAFNGQKVLYLGIAVTTSPTGKVLVINSINVQAIPR